MTERAAILAEQIERAVAGFSAELTGLSEEQWRTFCPNEGRSVGVVARHVAKGIPFEMDHFRIIAAGHQSPIHTMAENVAMNAADAEAWADCTKDDTLALLQEYAAAAAAEVRQWDDQQLARTGKYYEGGPEDRTVAQWIERTLIGHINDHLQSIRASLASS